MSGIFISYSGSRIDRAAPFFALRDHGLSPWRDVESLDLGDDTTAIIEDELAHCSGAILWINEDVLASAYVATVELPAIANAWERRGLRIVPIFDGISPSLASEHLSRLGLEVGENNGYVVDPGLGDDATAAEIARRYVRAHVADARQGGAAPVVRLVSYDDTADLRDNAVLNLDWRHHLTTGSLDPTAESRLRSALAAAAGAMKDAYGACEITMAVKSHLPLAFAVGHVFSEPTGCTLRMTRDGVDWRTTRSAASAALLKQHEGLQGPVDARAASIEVSVTRDVESGVNSYVASGHRYRHRLTLAPEHGPSRDSLDGPESANAWARQIAQGLTRTADRADVDRVDLFLATPVELAVLIGWWANATGAVQIMNWAGKSGPYKPMWTLP